MPVDGFVVAMRGRLTLVPDPARVAEPAWPERGGDAWFVVSRFGPAGGILAVGLVDADSGESAWPRLVPRMTLLGRHVAPRPGRAGLFFDLLGEPIPQLRVAGTWRATAGHARLCGTLPELRLLAAGRLAGGPAWRMHARRRPWIGDWPAADHDGPAPE